MLPTTTSFQHTTADVRNVSERGRPLPEVNNTTIIHQKAESEKRMPATEACRKVKVKAHAWHTRRRGGMPVRRKANKARCYHSI